MRKNSLVMGLVVASSFCSSVLAAENCKNPQNQIVENACVAKEHEREDAQLNKNYKYLAAKLDTEKKSRLKEVQIAWIKFRDLQCEYESAQYMNGTIYPFVLSSCLLRITKQRNKDLKAMLEDSHE